LAYTGSQLGLEFDTLVWGVDVLALLFPGS